jgi:hypothetical protein
MKTKQATRTSAKATRDTPVRRVPARVRKQTAPKGFICTLPFCGRLEVEDRARTIQLVSVDLFDPSAANPNRTWTTFRPPLINAQATASALRALWRAAVGGRADIPCFNVGCACRLSGIWSAWSRWQRVPISGGFSIRAPNPPPARLRYRANSTATMRVRFQPGFRHEVRVTS